MHRLAGYCTMRLLLLRRGPRRRPRRYSIDILYARSQQADPVALYSGMALLHAKEVGVRPSCTVLFLHFNWLFEAWDFLDCITVHYDLVVHTWIDHIYFTLDKLTMTECWTYNYNYFVLVVILLLLVLCYLACQPVRLLWSEVEQRGFPARTARKGSQRSLNIVHLWKLRATLCRLNTVGVVAPPLSVHNRPYLGEST